MFISRALPSSETGFRMQSQSRFDGLIIEVNLLFLTPLTGLKITGKSRVSS
jgi:hypothetical protein